MPKSYSSGSVELDIAPHEARQPARALPETPFRILLLGDFSAGATGPARRRPIAVDRDNLDDVIRAISPRIQLGTEPGSEPFELTFHCLEDFHPDQLYERVGFFRKLADLRERLDNPATSSAAASELSRWSEPAPAAAPPAASPTAGGGLLDQMLDAAEPSAAAPVRGVDPLSDFIRRAVAPSLVPGRDPRAAALMAQVDAAAAGLLRSILHDPRFQALESAWRAVDWLTRELETGVMLKLDLLDCSKSELAADLGAVEDPAASAFYRTLTGPGPEEPWAVVVGNFSFACTEADTALLAQLGLAACLAGVPLLAEADLGAASGTERESGLWQSLRGSAAGEYIGLALPRVMLRLPYGRNGASIESFRFEELPDPPEHEHFLWGNPAFACALLLGQAFSEFGWRMRPGMLRELTGLPMFVYRADGESVMKPLCRADDERTGSRERHRSRLYAAGVDSQPGHGPAAAFSVHCRSAGPAVRRLELSERPSYRPARRLLRLPSALGTGCAHRAKARSGRAGRRRPA